MPNDSFEHHNANINSIRLHYVTNGSGPLIMFLHGFPEFWAAWDHQLAEFGRDHLAVAPDMRGFNLSEKPTDPEQYHINTLIADIGALQDHLGHERMTLVAHDWGGAVAWTYAHRHPERLNKLIIINSPHPAVFARELAHNPEQQGASQYMNLFRQPDAEQIVSKDNYAYLMGALSKWGDKWPINDALRQSYIDAWSQPGALTGGLNYYRISVLHPATNEEEARVIQQIANLPREAFTVQVPTLVLWGELDEALRPGNLDGMDQYIDELTIQRIPDGTHWVIHEQPELINQSIRSFLDA